MIDRERRVPARILGPGADGHLEVVLMAGYGLADGGELVEVALEVIPPALRTPNTTVSVCLLGERVVAVEPEPGRPSIPWPGPWQPIRESDRAGFEAELHREVSPAHVLSGRQVRAIGRRQDNDDVAFLLPGPTPEFAIVHLTWRHEQEISPEWPWTVLYADLASFVVGLGEPNA